MMHFICCVSVYGVPLLRKQDLEEHTSVVFKLFNRGPVARIQFNCANFKKLLGEPSCTVTWVNGLRSVWRAHVVVSLSTSVSACCGFMGVTEHCWECKMHLTHRILSLVSCTLVSVLFSKTCYFLTTLLTTRMVVAVSSSESWSVSTKPYGARSQKPAI